MTLNFHIFSYFNSFLLPRLLTSVRQRNEVFRRMESVEPAAITLKRQQFLSFYLCFLIRNVDDCRDEGKGKGIF